MGSVLFESCIKSEIPKSWYLSQRFTHHTIRSMHTDVNLALTDTASPAKGVRVLDSRHRSSISTPDYQANNGHVGAMVAVHPYHQYRAIMRCSSILEYPLAVRMDF